MAEVTRNDSFQVLKIKEDERNLTRYENSILSECESIF